MKVYHTSNVAVPHPDTTHSRNYLDFGKGFYLTPIETQAKDYGQRFIRKGEPAILNIYELSEIDTHFSKKKFETYNGEWLDFITACRKGLAHEEYDIIEGGIADMHCLSDDYLAEEFIIEWNQCNLHT